MNPKWLRFSWQLMDNFRSKAHSWLFIQLLKKGGWGWGRVNVVGIEGHILSLFMGCFCLYRCFWVTASDYLFLFFLHPPKKVKPKLNIITTTIGTLFILYNDPFIPYSNLFFSKKNYLSTRVTMFWLSEAELSEGDKKIILYIQVEFLFHMYIVVMLIRILNFFSKNFSYVIVDCTRIT